MNLEHVHFQISAFSLCQQLSSGFVKKARAWLERRHWKAGRETLRKAHRFTAELTSQNNRSPEINAEKAGNISRHFPLIASIMFTADLLGASFVRLIIKNVCFASAAKATNSSF